MKTIVYDKVRWHFPEGKNCPSLDAAMAHLDAIMRWLNDRDLLSDEGKEALEVGIDADFALTSSMVTKAGNDFLQHAYPKWIVTIDYGQKPDTSILDEWRNAWSK
jgi:hypothetical protein